MKLDRAKRLAGHAHIHGYLSSFLSSVKDELPSREYKKLLEFCRGLK